MKVSVIFPARNEEEFIASSILDVHKYLKSKKYSFEVLVVDNGSNDNTAAIVKKLQKTKAEVKLLSTPPGYGIAIKKGLEKALGDYIIIFNVDFYDLHLIDLIDIDLLGKDLIIGSKMAPWSTDKRPQSRRIITYLFNLYLKIFYGFKGSDTHGIKVFKRSVLNNIYKKCKTTSGIFDSEFVIRAQRMGFKIMDYPVSIQEIRSSRFSKRFFQTPKDILNLFIALRK
ncbi:MAG: group 2 family glycosyl transferase [Microgenomates group bacterium GW2011_GWC1_37_8]|uniref:Glycosyl transferase, group 2 family protein n=1 Tax=Candidatus Woesebacteria bacterium GW2011_GWB1_38_8 TaxID=1618570 RepID=A0A0G0L588_9BACT|nr:MAG: group 2 family glycosyl transferase [Microgenomates group bacterium GW2011_GWC1_37_8]KKQ86177.1 MAG: Glycosyl transferase, group 2 family protein [Candidatus Woesebacteria bacterium GW2011_GWB1_38_8]